MPTLQVALDLVDLSQAKRVARALSQLDLRIEVGTPLLLAHGVHAIREIRAVAPSRLIVADCKVMDRGDLAVRVCRSAGADAVIVQAAADNATITAATDSASSLGCDLMLDSIGVSSGRIAELHAVAGRMDTIAHLSKDRQTATDRRVDPSSVRNMFTMANCIAGGIDLGLVNTSPEIQGFDIVIVGEAISSSLTPADSAAAILELLC